MKRFNTSITLKDVNSNVHLSGWVSKKRDLGGLIFIDLRDKSGIIQLVVRPDNKYYEVASNLKNESVISVSGTVVERESVNKNMETGMIEVIVDELEVINTSIDIPFTISDDTTAFKYLRRLR